jgi:hypothetical protein
MDPRTAATRLRVAAREHLRKASLLEDMGLREALEATRAMLDGADALERLFETSEPTPCPDCHRKDGSKCKEGATGGPSPCVCGHDYDAHSGHGLRPCRQVVCEINCCEYREAP